MAEEPMPLLPVSSSRTIRLCASLRLLPSDVFIASYPKSGTTWMQHIVHTLLTDAASPLEHISDASPFFEVDRTWDEEGRSELSPSVQANHSRLGRRMFNTHLRWEMMPRGGDARYIYMTRKGRDACVSFFHHLSHQAEEDGGYTGDFEAFVVDWTAGRVPFGSWSAHLKSWLGGEAATDARVLFVSYEALKADPLREVRRVSSHLGLSHSEERLTQLLPRFSFEWMRANEEQFNPRSVRWVASAQDARGEKDGCEERAVEEFHFIRRGEVGEGRQRFSAAQNELFTAMVQRSFPDGAPSYLAGIGE